MNNCTLMAEVIQDPQLRFTPDNQTAISEMWVQFPGLRDGDPSSKLKVVGWGDLAQEIQQRYHVGDKVVIEGRLQMNTINRQEGFKEKIAELTARKVYLLGAEGSVTTTSVPPAPITASAPAGKKRGAKVPAAA